VGQPVKSHRAPRTRRAEQAEQTRRRILNAATSLFTEEGFATTTIEAIAARADVAVETVYSRFRSKANLLDSILGPAITGKDDHRTLFDLPEFAEVRECTHQRQQLRLLAHFSRMVLQRTDQIHRILQTAASSDPTAAELYRVDSERRYRGQTAYIDMLLANGPLREHLTPSEAADTYAALANPTTYAFLTGDRGWSPERFEEWLADSLIRLLLP
jgi:AcrR family transcriptional regulator